MPRPHDLFHLRNVVVFLKDHHVVRLTTVRILGFGKSLLLVDNHCIVQDRNLNFALSGDRAEMSVVGEGDVVGGVPVEADCDSDYDYDHDYDDDYRSCFHHHHNHRCLYHCGHNCQEPVAAHGKGNGVQHIVDRSNHLFVIKLDVVLMRERKKC